MISPSACHPWQPDRAADPAQQRRCYTTQGDTIRALTAKGAQSWFLIAFDYAFGQAFADDIRKAVREGGGSVLGEVRHPLNTTDMSSYLLQAAAANSKVIALAAAGSDMANTVKQAAEFGLSSKVTLVAPIVFITDVHALGLQVAQGLQFFTAFYWDRPGGQVACFCLAMLPVP